MRFKNKLLKLLTLILIINLPGIGITSSYFSSQSSVLQNTFSTSCWVAPSVPVLISPANNTYLAAGDLWFSNPIMDWEDSTTSCPLATTIEYQFETYSDPGLSNLRYISSWLTESQITAPDTSDGTYYWRVRAKDEFGNMSEFSGAWLLYIDTVAPEISDVDYLIATPEEENDASAKITWKTNENATSNVYYRTDLADPWETLPLDTTADTTEHERELVGLLENTTYYFSVKSTDVAGNESIVGVIRFETGNTRYGVGWSDIVINEFLPNPEGSDNAAMPMGEWVELFNTGDNTVDLSGWYFSDMSSSRRLYITTGNTTSSDDATGGVLIGPGEFMVVYRNGDSDFSLNNDATGDAVQLWMPVGSGTTLVDIHVYTWLLGDEVFEDKSYARFPDGSNIWFDPIPTPGYENDLEDDPITQETVEESAVQEDEEQNPAPVSEETPVEILAVPEVPVTEDTLTPQVDSVLEPQEKPTEQEAPTNLVETPQNDGEIVDPEISEEIVSQTQEEQSEEPIIEEEALITEEELLLNEETIEEEPNEEAIEEDEEVTNEDASVEEEEEVITIAQ